MSTNPPPETPTSLPDLVTQFKQGWMTSEFWVALVGLAGGAVALFTDYTLDTQALLAAVIPAATYIAGRTWLKRKRIDGVVATTPTPVEPVVADEGDALSSLEPPLVPPEPPPAEPA